MVAPLIGLAAKEAAKYAAKKAGMDAGEKAISGFVLGTTGLGTLAANEIAADRRRKEAEKAAEEKEVREQQDREAAAEMRRETRGQVKFKKGGAIKSASARADGIAKRGKTRGRIV